MDLIKKYLEEENLAIGVIYSFDKNGNEYNHEFYLCKSGMADPTAWSLEMRKMENVGLYETTLEDAKELGLEDINDFYNYPYYEVNHPS